MTIPMRTKRTKLMTMKKMKAEKAFPRMKMTLNRSKITIYRNLLPFIPNLDNYNPLQLKGDLCDMP